MKFERVYFVNGTAYAGKSTLVKALAKKYDGIACEENYHDALLPELDKNEFPNLTYTRDLEDWHLFIRRTPEVYARWVRDVAKECEILELRMLEEIVKEGKPVFVDTNISVETLKDISDESHVLIMLSDPSISVNRFFERPDKEKQFLYQLMLEEEDPQAALDNFRQGLTLINSPENYEALLHSGFPVLLRDENRTPEQTLALAEEIFGLRK
ncbi:MAG: hypothetical protein IKM05_02150 [Clostridia bacterium]|nr:hypothetical protein [Clostridia bacterium]